MSTSTLTPIVVRERRSWRGGVRWFAAEFLVVVSGILVALGLQAWYQGRQETQAAHVYLDQLTTDLDATEKALQLAITQESARVEVTARIIAAFSDPEPLQPDTAHRWLKLQFGYYSDPRPVLGTVSTLVQTGDIKLIDNPVLRSGITAYLSLMQADLDELSRNVGRLTGASDVIRRRWEYSSLPPLVLPRFTSASLLPDRYTDAEATDMLSRFMRA